VKDGHCETEDAPFHIYHEIDVFTCRTLSSGVGKSAQGAITLPGGSHVHILFFCLVSNPCSTRPGLWVNLCCRFGPALAGSFLYSGRYVESQNCCPNVVRDVHILVEVSDAPIAIALDFSIFTLVPDAAP
jgi:hypothetical protein